MKSMDELFSRFNEIQDSPVSEEMIGAYVEGVLSPTEMSDIDTQFGEDSDLLQVANETTLDTADNLLGLGTSTSILDGIENWLNDQSFSSEDSMEIPDDISLSNDLVASVNSRHPDDWEEYSMDDSQCEELFSEKLSSTGDSSDIDSDSLDSDSPQVEDYDGFDLDF